MEIVWGRKNARKAIHYFLMTISAIVVFTHYPAIAMAGTWNPKTIDPARCQNPEVEPSRPPDPTGCDIEVRFTKTTLLTGQGISEGRAEITTEVTAEDLDGETTTTANYPDSGEGKYNVGQSMGHELDLGTYHLEIGETKHVEVCATFTEHDNGGLNGGDDVANACTVLFLHCDANHGQPSYTQPLGPAVFCGDNVCNGLMMGEVQVMRADADGDGVENDADFTPEPCDEERKGEEGVGLLLYYQYNDDGPTTFAQSLFTNLSQAYSAYDYVALVMDNETSNANNTSGAAFANADIVFPPTRQGLLDAMQHLTANGLRFDTFVHAHGYKKGASDSKFETIPKSGGFISGEWLVEATTPDNIGTALHGVPIISFWSTTCIAARQIDAWMVVGAKAASGAVDVQFYPQAWGNFINNWTTGIPYKPAVDISVTPAVIAESELLIQSQGQAPPWFCDPSAGLSVLGLNYCAEDFFNDDVGSREAQYNIYEVYDHSLSGAQNMAISSERLFLGNDIITFGGPGAFWP